MKVPSLFTRRTGPLPSLLTRGAGTLSSLLTSLPSTPLPSLRAGEGDDWFVHGRAGEGFVHVDTCVGDIERTRHAWVRGLSWAIMPCESGRHGHHAIFPQVMRTVALPRRLGKCAVAKGAAKLRCSQGGCPSTLLPRGLPKLRCQGGCSSALLRCPKEARDQCAGACSHRRGPLPCAIPYRGTFAQPRLSHSSALVARVHTAGIRRRLCRALYLTVHHTHGNTFHYAHRTVPCT